VKYAFIDKHRPRFAVTRLCRMVNVSRSGYNKWVARKGILTQREEANAKLLIDIRRVHVEYKQAYGSVKTWHTLRQRGIACGKHRVARLRRENGIEARRTRRQRTTKEHHKMAPPAPDLVEQQFHAEAPDRIWVGDMTFIRTREGWQHLAVLIDLFSRRVVGHAFDASPGQVVHQGALQMALRMRKPDAGLIHHTDRGAQYRAGAYKAVMAKHGIKPSMNGTAKPQDNAVAESFFSALKNELVHHETFSTRGEAKQMITEYIDRFFNRRRIHQSLGYRTPEQVEQEYRGANLNRPLKAG